MRKIVGVMDEDPLSDLTWSGSSKFFFNELDRQGVLAGSVSAEVSGVVRRYHQALSFTPGWDRWRFAYHLNTGLYGSMTESAISAVEPFLEDADVILQVGAWYDMTRIPGKMHVSYHDGNLATLLASPYGHPDVSKRVIKKALEWERSLYSRMDKIFPMSGWLAESFHKDFGVPLSKLHPVGAGINLPYVRDVGERSYEEKKILMVGKNFDRKGGKYLLKAFEQVRKIFPEAQLTIVGPDLRDLPPNVQCLGFLDKRSSVDVEKLLDAYASHSIFVMPSLYEPFGIVFAEAMAHRLPCIGTNTCAMPEIIEHGINGFIVEPADEIELAKRMIELLSDPRLCKAMGDKGYQSYQRSYNWRSVVEKIVSIVDAPL